MVGSATSANWPKNCVDFRNLEKTTLWKQTPVPSGPVPEWIVREANNDLQYLVETLEQHHITVHRPTDMDFVSADGFYNYCPRDRLLVLGDKVVDAPMAIQCRQMEINNYDFLDVEYISCDDPSAMFDAANICRLDKDLLYLVSSSGNTKGAEWLQKKFPEYRVHVLDNVYSGVHIDSTIVPIRPGLVVLNANRINQHNIPEPLKNWDKIWAHDENIFAQSFYEYPYASKWIGINLLVIDPYTVVCDPNQQWLIEQLEMHSVKCIGVNLRHSRTLGGGHHCVTLDLHRS